MKTFFALVHKDQDSAFGVTFPDVPGCFSAADRADDIIPNASEALSLWFEDADAATPRDLAAISEEVAADLACGAFLVAVPLLTRSTRTVRINLSINHGTLADIDAAAAARKLTRSAFLVEAARNEMLGLH